jgi:hypothetical protein
MPSGSVVYGKSRSHALSNHNVRLTRIYSDRIAVRRRAQRVAKADCRWSWSGSCADVERKNGHRAI